MDVSPDIVISICLGIGLSAACGFRVFIPLLAVSAASLAGYLRLSSGFEWLGTYPAFWTFATAALLEAAAYFIPWIDHLMDSIAGPAAVIAGTLLMASSLTVMSPWLKWTLAIIAGGGSAALVQSSSMILRVLSTTLTGGFGNFAVAAVELVSAAILSILAIVWPVVAAITVAAIVLIIVVKLLGKMKSGAKAIR